MHIYSVDASGDVFVGYYSISYSISDIFYPISKNQWNHFSSPHAMHIKSGLLLLTRGRNELFIILIFNKGKNQIFNV